MSAVIALGGGLNFFPRPEDTGASTVAQELSRSHKKARSDLTVNSVIWDAKLRLEDELREVYKECSIPGWDGYNAAPIEPAAVIEALSFINALSTTGLPLPDIVPEPEGSIGFEWYFGNDYVFVVSLKGDDTLTFAGMLGPSSTRYGTEVFNDAIPKFLAEYVWQAEEKARTV